MGIITEQPPIITPNPISTTPIQYELPKPPTLPVVVPVPQQPGGSVLTQPSNTDVTVNNNSNQTASNAAELKAVQNINFHALSQFQVGDIVSQHAAVNISASQNEYAGFSITANVSIPLGGTSIRRSAKRVAQARADVAMGSVCKSIRDNGFDFDMVTALYGDKTPYVACVKKVQATMQNPDRPIAQDRSQYDSEIESLKLRLKVLQEQADLHKNNVPTPVNGLW